MSGPDLKWLDQALRDMEGLTEYIAGDNPDAALELKTEIMRKVGLLSLHPRLYRPGRLKGAREMVIRKNYMVVYMETPETVTVLRVLHTSMQWP